MDAKAQIEAARRAVVASEVAGRGKSLELRYLLIRKFVKDILSVKYVSYCEISYATQKNRYSEKKLLDLHRMVWGEK